jgi:hypothetical protein
MEILSEEMPASSISVVVSKPLVNTKQIITPSQNTTTTNNNSILSSNRLPVQLAPVPEIKSSNNNRLTKTNYNLAAFAPYGNDFTLPNRNNLDQTVQNRIEMFNNNKNK